MARNTPKNATVAMTTPVVEITSSRLGQVTCFTSTRTSWRNSFVPAIEPVTLRVSSLPLDSSLFTLTACIAINPFHPHEPCGSCPYKILAGEEGFEPPYPVLETGVLTVGPLPFTLSLPFRRRVYPFAQKKPLNLLLPAPALNFFFPSPRCFTASTAFLPNQFHRSAFRGVIGSNSPIVPLDSVFYVDCNPHVERIIATSKHVTEPNCFRPRHVPCCLRPGF